MKRTLREYLATWPAFRDRPVGAPASPSRIAQQREMALEDKARALLSEPAR